jgi:hypothetical protein
MATATVDIDAFLTGRTDEELQTIAAKAIKQLLDRGGETADPFRVSAEGNPEVYLIHPVRPTYTIKTQEELIAEAKRRAKSPFRPLTTEEFLARIDK